jgi:hypothetical protein
MVFKQLFTFSKACCSIETSWAFVKNARSPLFILRVESTLLGSGFVIKSLARVEQAENAINTNLLNCGINCLGDLLPVAESAINTTLRHCGNNYQGKFYSICPRSVIFTLTTGACAKKTLWIRNLWIPQ